MKRVLLLNIVVVLLIASIGGCGDDIDPYADMSDEVVGNWRDVYEHGEVRIVDKLLDSVIIDSIVVTVDTIYSDSMRFRKFTGDSLYGYTRYSVGYTERTIILYAVFGKILVCYDWYTDDTSEVYRLEKTDEGIALNYSIGTIDTIIPDSLIETRYYDKRYEYIPYAGKVPPEEWGLFEP